MSKQEMKDEAKKRKKERELKEKEAKKLDKAERKIRALEDELRGLQHLLNKNYESAGLELIDFERLERESEEPLATQEQLGKLIQRNESRLGQRIMELKSEKQSKKGTLDKYIAEERALKSQLDQTQRAMESARAQETKSLEALLKLIAEIQVRNTSIEGSQAKLVQLASQREGYERLMSKLESTLTDQLTDQQKLEQIHAQTQSRLTTALTHCRNLMTLVTQNTLSVQQMSTQSDLLVGEVADLEARREYL
ncbi:hypothetical protein HK102_013032, partial [Quaeritorhiza haematococci]